MNMKKHRLHSLIVLGSLFCAGCSNWLDVVPENDVETIETQFEKREDAEKWLKTCYISLTVNEAEATTYHTSTGNPAYLGADEFCGGEYARKTDVLSSLFIGDGLQMGQDPYANVWHKQQHYAAIRYCNIFIDKIDGVYDMKEEEKKIWKAEVQAVKAFYYFDLMRRYGPIVLVPENIEPNEDFSTMQQTRRPIDECVAAIVELCDKAMAELPYMSQKMEDHKLYFNKESVAALKALTLLYAASPLFNGNTLFQNFTNKNGERLFPAEDKGKWRRAAEYCDTALMICRQAGKSLASGFSKYPTKLLNTMMDIERTWVGDGYDSPEALLTVNNMYDFLLGYTIVYGDVNNSKYYDRLSKGCLGAPLKMVEMFYTEHGLPISEDNQWLPFKYAMEKEVDERYRYVIPLDGTRVLSLHLRREPRFYAMIAADRTLWYRRTSSSGATQYEALPVETRRGEVLGTQLKRVDELKPQNLTGYWIKKGLYTEHPLYNYQTTFSQPKVRYVFRLAELYLAAAEAWNECDPGNEKVYQYLDEVRTRAGILPVRDAWKTYAKNPDKVNTQDGMRDIIRQEWNIEFAFEGRRYWNLRRWMTAQQELNTAQTGWNVFSDTEEGFYCNFIEPMEVWKKRSFTAPRDYFTPIRSEEILISGIVQNPGW